ncbi:hypothetical protein SI859A1_00936 [Aurantimonas manganoxydans SI85-9A1]|uniref:Uncharacterized protein n=1 Tax=Aurantimonas manganoxydans (strain ATCC BAA-1229 / DSM 21871 / SI85-9A1) TaxID=287752 RepID=Q1YJR2_AURMS|nr:hypothetical protein SI859A1_00936 [Aurantimonas manganoxydans SI85-9A1]
MGRMSGALAWTVWTPAGCWKPCNTGAVQTVQTVQGSKKLEIRDTGRERDRPLTQGIGPEKKIGSISLDCLDEGHFPMFFKGIERPRTLDRIWTVWTIWTAGKAGSRAQQNAGRRDYA